MKETRTSRRQFLQAAGLAAAAPYVITSTALGGAGRPPASERIVMGLIGAGGRGTYDMEEFIKFPEVQMVATCDPVPGHREAAREIVNKKYKNRDCKDYNDFRDVLARDDIDAVQIGTPDHWHALITIEACKHGKDVFCEKPESLTIRDGRAMVEAVRRYGRVFSGGSQRVQGDYGDWPRLLWAGAVGQIREVFISCGGPSGDCFLEPQPVPRGLDWDMWLGPAPWRPFHEKLDQRRLPRLSRLFRRRHDRLGGPSFRRRHVRLPLALHRPRGGHPARRQGREISDLCFRQRHADVPRRHR